MRQKWKAVLAIILCILLITGCTKAKTSDSSSSAQGTTNSSSDTNTSNGSSSGTQDTSQTSSAEAIQTSTDIEFDGKDSYNGEIPSDATKISLNKGAAEINGQGAKADGKIITINAAGVYVISGDSEDAQIVVNAGDKDKVQLILNGVTLACQDSSPIYIQKADKVTISLPEGTKNTLSDTKNYVLADSTNNEPNATIYSKADLLINGKGTLNISANYGKAINSRDDLTIIEAALQITSVEDGIIGHDMFAAKNAVITINAGQDGIKSTNTEDAAKGFIVVKGGTYQITSENDGIQAATTVLLSDTEINIVSGGGSVNAKVKTNNDGWGNFGNRNNTSNDTSSSNDTTASSDTTGSADAAAEESTSAKGIKAAAVLTINGGSFTIDSADDTLHSNGYFTTSDAALDLTAGDDGIHANTQLDILSGTINIKKSNEGIESSLINVKDGKVQLTSSDDGFNVSGGADGSAADGANQDGFNAINGVSLNISGGYVYVDAEGDGLDSNASMSISGGTILVNGPSGNGNGALDYNGTCEITGGTLIAAGSSGMAMAPSDTSSQYSIGVLFTQTQTAGTLVHLEDSKGNSIADFAPAKTFSSIVVSSPAMKKGETYTVYTGGSSTGTAENGYYSNGTYKAGNKLVQFTIADPITWVDESGITTHTESFGGGMGGGRKGNMNGFPNDGTRPGNGKMPPNGNLPGGTPGNTDGGTTNPSGDSSTGSSDTTDNTNS